MTKRFLVLTASLAVGTVAFAGCERDTPTATESTVRLAVIAGAEHGGAPLPTDMTQEVTAVPPWAGDPDGTGTALITVNPGQREVCWSLTAEDVTLPATAAHIHRAPDGVRGGIVVPLSPPDQTGQATGCASDISRDLLLEILRSPESFYVNVHTSDYPPGAIRGQLAR
jgi:hypothetical protein